MTPQNLLAAMMLVLLHLLLVDSLLVLKDNDILYFIHTSNAKVNANFIINNYPLELLTEKKTSALYNTILSFSYLINFTSVPMLHKFIYSVKTSYR